MKKYKLIKTYPGSEVLGTIASRSSGNGIIYNNGITETSSKGDIFTSNIVNQPEFWQPVVEKDYEILEIKGKYGTISSYIEELDHNLKDQTIFKVKRLSDGEIFTIDDKCEEYGKIHSFLLQNDTIFINEKFMKIILSKIKKVKKPLFTTEDGVDIFEGDIYYYVSKNSPNTLNKLIANNYSHPTENVTVYNYYASKEKAEEWIIMNKPCLSWKEVSNFLTNKFNNGYADINSINKLKELVKSKL